MTWNPIYEPEVEAALDRGLYRKVMRELKKGYWKDVCSELRPDITPDEFEELWSKFEELMGKNI